MKKVIAIIVSLVFVLSFAGLSFAADKAAKMEDKKAPAEAAEKKAPAKVKSITGEVAAVDAKANTVTVKVKKGDVTVMTDAKTKVMMGKEKKMAADVKAGDKVTVKYTEADGKMMAKSIAIKPAEAEKKMEKKEKKAEPAAKPAEKK
jgi:ribosomal protein S1